MSPVETACGAGGGSVRGDGRTATGRHESRSPGTLWYVVVDTRMGRGEEPTFRNAGGKQIAFGERYAVRCRPWCQRDRNLVVARDDSLRSRQFGAVHKTVRLLLRDEVRARIEPRKLIGPLGVGRRCERDGLTGRRRAVERDLNIGQNRLTWIQYPVLIDVNEHLASDDS